MRKRIASVAFGALAMVLAVSAPSQAQGVHGHGSAGGHAGGAMGHHGFEGGHGGGAMEHHGFEGGHGGGAMEHHGIEGHHFEGHDFDRRHFDGRGFWLGPVYPYYPPDYAPNEAAPGYWYYCPSAGAYYPSVTSCPEAWVTVPPE
jgi:hypothetical protein